MHKDSMHAVAVDLDHYWKTATYGHAATIASDSTALVLERLPTGNYSWLQPDEDARYVLTERGRQNLSEAPNGTASRRRGR
jgi:hypothetical protein